MSASILCPMSFGGDFVQAEMLKVFIDSDEYRQWFGQ
jgi:hypothetical protein